MLEIKNTGKSMLELSKYGLEVGIKTLQDTCHTLAKDAGWHDKPREVGTMLCLVHSEVSEAMEGYRKDLMELMESKRLEIAVELFKKDPMLLKAIMTELAMESLLVGKNTIIREAIRCWGLDAFEAKPYLQGIDLDNFVTFNIHWSLEPYEREYYMNKINNNLSPEEAAKAWDKIKKRFDIVE